MNFRSPLLIAFRLFPWLALTATTPTLALPKDAPCSEWQTAWMASPQRAWDGQFVLPLGMPANVHDVTIRQSLRIGLSGDRLRLVVGNVYGKRPLRIGRAAVRLEGAKDAVRVFFAGAPHAVLAPNEELASDPVNLPLHVGDRLEVDLYLPEPSALASFHWNANDAGTLLPGDATRRLTNTVATQVTTRAFLAEVLVESPFAAPAVVAIGDSITDGNGSTAGADQRWPDHLARRLAPHGIVVLNAGIAGNRLLQPGMGDSALARFEHDVLRHCAVSAVIVLLGTNDIGLPGGPFAPTEPAVTLDELMSGLQQLVHLAHAKGIVVIGGTIPPFKDALQGTPLEGHYSPAKESMRQALNAWCRQAGVFDALADFDVALRDPLQVERLRPDLDSGDHLHPGDAGYRVMAEAIDLGVVIRAASARKRP